MKLPKSVQSLYPDVVMQQLIAFIEAGGIDDEMRKKYIILLAKRLNGQLDKALALEREVAELHSGHSYTTAMDNLLSCCHLCGDRGANDTMRDLYNERWADDIRRYNHDKTTKEALKSTINNGIKCRHCREVNTSISDLRNTRGGDEGVTAIYKCIACGGTWRGSG